MADSVRLKSFTNKRNHSMISNSEVPSKILKDHEGYRSFQSMNMDQEVELEEYEEPMYSSQESSFDEEDLFDDLDDAVLNAPSLTQRNEELINGNDESTNRSVHGLANGISQLEAGGRQDFYGLPMKAKTILEKFRKIEKLHSWQEKLLKRLLDKECNMIYCAPTGGGKTLVAEIMLIREVVLHKRDAILVLPFISIVQEKMRALLPFAESLGFALEEYAGGKGSYPVKKRKSMRSLFVCTMEKTHVVFTSLMEQNRLDDVGLVVVDELHMIGDSGSRGVTLETLLIKLKLASKNNPPSKRLRFLGMSATLSNLNELTKFLDAEIYQDHSRPVELKQYIKRQNALIEVTGFREGLQLKDMPRTHITDEDPRPDDPENLRALVGERVPNSSVLVFCPTKKQCENVAKLLAKNLNKKLLEYKAPQKQKLILKIYDLNNKNISPILRMTIPVGIAYHHSGLSPDERRIIEDAFRHQIISCICCTSTLAAGVNLPAERVIIRSPYIGMNFMTKAEYQQICGRAGRPGLSKFGESILIHDFKDGDRVKELLEQPVAQCRSSLNSVDDLMSAFILSLLQLNLVSVIEDIKKVVKEVSLCGIQNSHAELERFVDDCVNKLVGLKLLELNGSAISVTAVGKGVVKSLIDVSRTLEVYQELVKAQDKMFLRTQLHMFFLVTLLFEDSELTNDNETDATLLFDLYQQLDEHEMAAAAAMGITTGGMITYVKGGRPSHQLRRFFVTLIIYEVWKKRTDLFVVAEKYCLETGRVFGLMSSASTCANKLFRFVEEVGLWAYRCLMPDVCEALTYCCSPELIPLMKLPNIRLPRARILFNAGFMKIIEIAQIEDPRDLISRLPEKTMNIGQAKALIRDARYLIKEEKDELEMKVTEMKVPDDLNSEDNFNCSNFSIFTEEQQE